MERIGLAASRMANGSLLKYNVFVVAISCFFSILIFLVCGFSVLAVLLLLSLVMRWFMPTDVFSNWTAIVKVSIAALAVIIGMLNIFAIAKNIKFSKKKI
jgi:hypothetical protein